MSEGMLTLEQLKAEVKAGTIDTVVAAMVDLQGRLIGKRFHAKFFVDGGYGCVHPWPEFGDAPVEEQLRLLSEGVTTPVTAMALRCAEIDGEARRAGVSLFEGLEIPRSHYSWSFATDTEAQMERVLAALGPADRTEGDATP